MKCLFEELYLSIVRCHHAVANRLIMKACVLHCYSTPSPAILCNLKLAVSSIKGSLPTCALYGWARKHAKTSPTPSQRSLFFQSAVLKSTPLPTFQHIIQSSPCYVFWSKHSSNEVPRFRQQNCCFLGHQDVERSIRATPFLTLQTLMFYLGIAASHGLVLLC